MVRCAITDGMHATADPNSQREALLRSAHRWALEGIELIQLREKHFEAGELLRLATDVLRVIRSQPGCRTKLLINGRADVAIAACADGVHLTADPGELTPDQVRSLYTRTSMPAPLITVSCHTLEDVARARDGRPDYVLFGPIFEKRVDNNVVKTGVGIELLHEACSAALPVPVLALGGISAANTAQCLHAGAAGVAGIRLFA